MSRYSDSFWSRYSDLEDFFGAMNDDNRDSECARMQHRRFWHQLAQGIAAMAGKCPECREWLNDYGQCGCDDGAVGWSEDTYTPNR